MADGKVYIPVQADASSYALRSVSSGGGASTPVMGTISWTFAGGLTGLGWENPRVIGYVDGDTEEQINAKIQAAYTGDQQLLADLMILQSNNCFSW